MSCSDMQGVALEEMMLSMRRAIALLASLAVYILALFLPAFRFSEGDSGFLIGIVCLMFGFEHAAWWANLVYFGSLAAYFFSKNVIAALVSVAAIAIAWTSTGIEQVPQNSAGTLTDVSGMGVGFYFWVASMAVFAVLGFVGLVFDKGGGKRKESVS